MMKEKLQQYFGDRAFYRMVIGVALPIAVQNAISNFVNLLDNLMVGQLGTEAMSAVSVVNQFMFIFNLLIFGAVSAGGIFMAQFHGRGDTEGERHTFRFKIIICFTAGVICVILFALFREELISLFLKGETVKGDAALTLSLGKQYLSISLAGMIPFAIASVYASSMRETGDTVTPMIASVVSVLTNFVFNSLLIFGLFGFPKMGVVGAAIATVIARFAELLILVIRTHRHPSRYLYIADVYRSLVLPRGLFIQITKRGLPLMLNELFWSMAVTFANQCYSTRGLDVVAAQSIVTTVSNVASVVYLSMGSAVSIIIGNLLGRGALDEARTTIRKMIVFSVLLCAGTAGMLAGISGVFPLLYKTSADVRSLATDMILIVAALMPFCAFTNAAYFAIRSGGQVLITILFDSVFMWTVLVPLVWCLSTFTGIEIHLLFLIGQSTEIIKCILGYIFLKRGKWVKQIVQEE